MSVAIMGRSPYGTYAAKSKSAQVGAVSDRTASAVWGAAEGAMAVALWLPIGFKERHPIWGTLFGIASAFNIADAAFP